MPSSLDLEMNSLNNQDSHPDRPATDHGVAEPLLAAQPGHTSSKTSHEGLTDDNRDLKSMLRRICPAGIASLTVQIPESNKGASSSGRSTKLQSSAKARSASKQSRWNTREFYCYYAIIVLYLLLMIRTTIRLSDGEWRLLHSSIEG